MNRTAPSPEQSFPPVTRGELSGLFRTLGLKPGTEVMVHSALSSLGYAVNGALDVIDALTDCVGVGGTVLMPAHSGQLTDPAGWRNPPLPPEHVQTVRDHMHPFDPRVTPVRNRGEVARTFLTYPGVMRSYHPLNSVAARGAEAIRYTAHHDLQEPEGLRSPSGVLYERGGRVLLIGVTLTACTGLHLAEYLADCPYLYESGVRVLVRGKGGNSFIRLERYPGTSEHFDKLLPLLRGAGLLAEAETANGLSLAFPFREAVDMALEKLRKDPEWLITP